MDPTPLLEELFPAEALTDVEEDTAAEEAELDILTVTELVRRCQEALDSHIPWAWVEGEISNLRIPASGHCYFTLKDEEAQIRAVLFRGQAVSLPFELEDGLSVVCHAELNVYRPRGDLQLVVRRIMPKGEGALRLAFEQLKKRLEAEGLFDEGRKRPLPLVPERVFLVTSPTGAAVRDFIRTARNLEGGGQIILCPVQVQGEKAAQTVIGALRTVDEIAAPGDVTVITRGGGSLEDLWPFNDEGLARAIYSASIPVVSAIGHEIDFTIADFVADVRAATPTAAAHLVFGEKRRLAEQVTTLSSGLWRGFGRIVEMAGNRLALLSQRLRSPQEILIQKRIYVDDLARRVDAAASKAVGAKEMTLHRLVHRLGAVGPHSQVEAGRYRFQVAKRALVKLGRETLQQKGRELGRLAGLLESASPLAVMARGFCVVQRERDGSVVRDAAGVEEGETLLVRPHRGRLRCTVIEKEEE